MGSFSVNVRKFQVNTQQRIDTECRKIAKELFRLVIYYTPVGSPHAEHGFLVNSWNAAVGSFDVRYSSDVGDPTWASTIRRMERNIPVGSFYFDSFVSLANGAPYAYRAEHLGWPVGVEDGKSMTTQPYRMVKKSLIEISSKYR